MWSRNTWSTRWSTKKIAALSLAIGITIPAAFAVGSPNVNSQYGSPGIFGYDFRDLSFPNPGFPDTYGVRRDSYGALRDADMLPDNSVIGHVPGQFQDLGLRKQLPYPYNMGGYEMGWYGPFPGTNFPPAGNGYINTGSGFSNAFNNFGRNFETAAGTFLPNGWFGNGFSGNGVETSTLAAEYGAGALGITGDASMLQPANNLGLVARGFLIQPGASYNVRNPLAGGSTVNAGSPANAIAGSPTGNFGLSNPLSGSIAAGTQVATVGTTNFSAIAPTQAQNIPALTRVATAANLPVGQPLNFNVSGPTTNFGGPNIPVGPIGQTNFSITSVPPRNGSFGNSAVANVNPQLGSNAQAQAPQISAVGATNFSQNNSALPNPATLPPYSVSLQPRPFGSPSAGVVPNTTVINPIGANNFSLSQDINDSATLARLASDARGRSPLFPLSGSTDFTAVAPFNTNTGVNYATPGTTDFSPIVATRAAESPRTIGGANQQPDASGTRSNIQTYGNVPSTSPTIASVGNSQFSAVSPARVQNVSPPITVNNTVAQGIAPTNFAGGFTGGLVPGAGLPERPWNTPPQLRRFAPRTTYVPPMAPITRRTRRPDYTLAQSGRTPTVASSAGLNGVSNIPSSAPGLGPSIAQNPQHPSAGLRTMRTVATTARTSGITNTYSTVRRTVHTPSADTIIVNAIGRVTGSMQYADGTVTIFGTRGTAKETPDQRVIVTLQNGQTFALQHAAQAARQIAAGSQASM